MFHEEAQNWLISHAPETDGDFYFPVTSIFMVVDFTIRQETKSFHQRGKSPSWRNLQTPAIRFLMFFIVTFRNPRVKLQKVVVHDCPQIIDNSTLWSVRSFSGRQLFNFPSYRFDSFLHTANWAFQSAICGMNFLTDCVISWFESYARINFWGLIGKE